MYSRTTTPGPSAERVEGRYDARAPGGGVGAGGAVQGRRLGARVYRPPAENGLNNDDDDVGGGGHDYDALASPKVVSAFSLTRPGRG